MIVMCSSSNKGQAQAIFTFNLKDFPQKYLEFFLIFQLSILMNFLSDMFELNPSSCIKAAQQHRQSLKNPPMTVETFLGCLQKQKLPQFISHFTGIPDIIISTSTRIISHFLS